MNEMKGEWLTTHEAMAVLHVGRTRLWRLVHEGGLTAYQRGPDRRARFYKRAEVQSLAREYRPATKGDHNERKRG
jgi:excisionase family DNA binding protein